MSSMVLLSMNQLPTAVPIHREDPSYLSCQVANFNRVSFLSEFGTRNLLRVAPQIMSGTELRSTSASNGICSLLFAISTPSSR